MIVDFGSVFNDPGAVAMNAKGNPLVVVVNNNGFSTNKLNSFVIDYSATDENGQTVTVSRTISVKVNNTDLVGTYSVQSDCKYNIPSVPLPVNFFKNTADIVAGSGTNKLEFTNIDFASGNDIFYGTINDNNIDLTGSLTISPVGIPTPFTYQFTGTGTISENARVITVSYIWENITPIVGGGIGSCVAIYTKN